MNLCIRHEIIYQYDRAVLIEPLTVRLRPRDDVYHRLIDFDLHVDPEPVSRFESCDAAGNLVTTLCFAKTQQHLKLTTISRVRTLMDNPFNYYVTDPQSLHLPTRYSGPNTSLLDVYRVRQQLQTPVDALAHEIMHSCGGQTQAFLSVLAEQLRSSCEMVVREDGEPMTPAQTLAERRGACRDLAVLFIDVCRAVGLAARFVSGYAYHTIPAAEHHLHAWAEVYLPGPGWRGYDPSAGIAVADHHVAVAAGPEPDAAAPTTGSFRGTGATSNMMFRVDVEQT